MKIPAQFNKQMAKHFYDKTITIFTSKPTKDDLGRVVGIEKTKIATIACNIQQNTKELGERDFGHYEIATFRVSCDKSAQIFNDQLIEIIGDSQEYIVKNVVTRDSHKLVLIGLHGDIARTISYGDKD